LGYPSLVAGSMLGLPGAEAQPGALHLPVDAAIGVPSDHGGCGGAGAGEYLIAGESHALPVRGGGDGSFPDEFVTYAL